MAEDQLLLARRFSIVWVTAAFTVGKQMPVVGLGLGLLVLYPAWDAVANWLDARLSGGLAHNSTEKRNVLASSIVTLAIAVALASGCMRCSAYSACGRGSSASCSSQPALVAGRPTALNGQ